MFLVLNRVVLLAGGKPLACQGLFISFLHLNVAALQLKRPRQSTTRSHAGEIFGSVNSEDITENFGQNRRESADMQIDRIDAHEHKTKPVFSMRTTRQIGEAEEAALHVEFILGNRWGGHQLAHESPRRSSIRLYEGRLLAGPFGIPKCTVDYIERIPKLLGLRSPCFGVGDQELDDGGRVNDPSIAFPKAACPSCDGLLPYAKLVVEIELFVVYRLRYGAWARDGSRRWVLRWWGVGVGGGGKRRRGGAALGVRQRTDGGCAEWTGRRIAWRVGGVVSVLRGVLYWRRKGRGVRRVMMGGWKRMRMCRRMCMGVSRGMGMCGGMRVNRRGCRSTLRA